MSKELFATRSWVETIALTGSTPLLKTVTTSQLSELINESSLVPGYIYRLTDYVCVPANPATQASAGHQFDILFLAISTNKLHKKCFADHHEGDAYFANSDLSKWDLDVSFDATTGVVTVTRMRDEFENECFFDFKNLKSTLTISGTTGLFYHFRDSSGGDDTLSGNSYNNKVGKDSIDFSAGPGNCSIRVGANCKGWVSDSDCSNWKVGDNCSNWKCGSSCNAFTAGTGSSSWEIGSNVSGWSCGEYCSDWKTLDTQDAVIGDFNSFRIESGNSNFDMIRQSSSGTVKNFTIGFGSSASLSSTMPRAKVTFTEVNQNYHTLVVPFNSITLQV